MLIKKINHAIKEINRLAALWFVYQHSTDVSSTKCWLGAAYIFKYSVLLGELLFKLENLLNAMGLRMMPLPGFQIYLWSFLTLIFDLQTPKVDSFTLLPRRPLVPICISSH